MTELKISLEKICKEKGEEWFEQIRGEALESHHLYANDSNRENYVNAYMKGRYMKEKRE